MPWLRDKLVSDRSLVVMGKWVTMVHMDIKNYCLGLNHMENGGFDRETGQECVWPVYDSYLAWQR